MFVLLVAAGAVAYTRTRDSCGEAVTSLPAGKSISPFLDAEQRAQQPDENRDALVDTLAGDPAPIGEALGAVGYHYEQWAQVSSSTPRASECVRATTPTSRCWTTPR